MRLTRLCVLCLFSPAPLLYCTIFALLSFSLSVPLWQDGTEEAVVYPDKLPIVSGGNSLWEAVPREQDAARHEKLTAEALAVVGFFCFRPLGSGARGKVAILWDWKR